MSLVVNCLGGPGVGKSAFAARIFAELKRPGASCELVTEYPKDLVWEENQRAVRDQLYVFANQVYQQELIRDRVEIIITDSPLLLSAVYNADLTSGTFKQLVL
jgi:adenylate kinase family enzyme